jgi:hypothetical protein
MEHECQLKQKNVLLLNGGYLSLFNFVTCEIMGSHGEVRRKVIYVILIFGILSLEENPNWSDVIMG